MDVWMEEAVRAKTHCKKTGAISYRFRALSYQLSCASTILLSTIGFMVLNELRTEQRTFGML